MLRDHSFPAGSRKQGCERGGGRETGYQCVLLDFYFEDTRSIKEKKQPKVRTLKSSQVTRESFCFYDGLYFKVSVV